MEFGSKFAVLGSPLTEEIFQGLFPLSICQIHRASLYKLTIKY